MSDAETPTPGDQPTALVLSERDALGRLGPGNRHRFKPGNRAAPGAQPPWVRAVRNNLEACVSEGVLFLQRVISGEPCEVMGPDGVAIQVRPNLGDRIRAVEIALSYAVAKPKVSLEVSGPEGEALNLALLSDSDLAKLEELVDRAATPPPA